MTAFLHQNIFILTKSNCQLLSNPCIVLVYVFIYLYLNKILFALTKLNKVKRIFFIKGGDKVVCAAITISPNGSVSLVSKLCTEQLATLCYTHKLHRDHQNTTGNDGNIFFVVYFISLAYACN